MLVLAFCVTGLCACGVSLDKMVGSYKIDETVYYAMLADTAYNPTEKYKVEKIDGKTKLMHNYIGISGEDVSVEVGELKKFSLKKNNFDNLIFGQAFDDGYSAESIRKNNKTAWKAEGKNGEKIYLLCQKDGEVLTVTIKTKEGVTACAHIRKIALVTE